MTAPPVARLAYITQPDADTVLLNLQFDAGQHRVSDVSADGSRFERVQINMTQLKRMIEAGMEMGVLR